jgi:hypothetical protein
MLKTERRGKKGIFQIIGTLRGRRVYQSTGTTSESHAEAARIQLEKQILDEDIYGKASTAVFAEAAEAYLDVGGSPSFVTPLNNHFGQWRLADISQAEVMKFAKKCYPNASPQTIDRQVFTPLIAIWRKARKAVRTARILQARAARAPGRRLCQGRLHRQVAAGLQRAAQGCCAAHHVLRRARFRVLQPVGRGR